MVVGEYAMAIDLPFEIHLPPIATGLSFDTEKLEMVYLGGRNGVQQWRFQYPHNPPGRFRTHTPEGALESDDETIHWLLLSLMFYGVALKTTPENVIGLLALVGRWGEETRFIDRDADRLFHYNVIPEIAEEIRRNNVVRIRRPRIKPDSSDFISNLTAQPFRSHCKGYISTVSADPIFMLFEAPEAVKNLYFDGFRTNRISAEETGAATSLLSGMCKVERANRGLTQRQVAKEIGIVQGHYSKIERGMIPRKRVRRQIFQWLEQNLVA